MQLLEKNKNDTKIYTYVILNNNCYLCDNKSFYS